MRRLAPRSIGEFYFAVMCRRHELIHVRISPSVAGLRKLWCPEVVELMESMWAQDPKERPPIAEVVDELKAMIANL